MDSKSLPYECNEDTYYVNIPVFEGPLDLLLHLIKKDKIDIYDIPIADICESYLNYINLMKKPNVSLAGEFMVMAATLMHIKSAMLLPSEETAEEEDPRTPLVAQLIEYEKFQKASRVLNSWSWLNRDIYSRPIFSKDLLPPEAISRIIEPVEMYHLLLAFKHSLDRTNRPQIVLQTEKISIQDKVKEISLVLKEKDTVDIFDLLYEKVSKKEMIFIFLAILELARLHFIEIIQNEIFGPILIRRICEFNEVNLELIDNF